MAVCRQPEPDSHKTGLFGFSLLSRALLPVPQLLAGAESPPSPGMAGVKVGTSATLLRALPAPAAPLPHRSAPLAPVGPRGTRTRLGAGGTRGCGGDGRSGGSLAPRPLAGASSRPDARRGSRLPQEQFRRCFNVSQNAGNKRNFNGV